ncbi:MAG: DNA-directed RNA polymerase subunit alpha C-terminal domain-containing protein [Candidatus Melainabacteria bacterium]|nr:DNA-directed RNA polymerase subunit alpha C-terminal domain-containing protein [Candidatus Melainabacteria bacterium]
MDDEVLVVPPWLTRRQITELDCSLLQDFASQFVLVNFGEISLENLHSSNVARNNLADFYKLVRLLGLYGVQFHGELARYSRKLHATPVLIDVSTSDSRSLFETKIERSTVLFLNNLTINRVQHLRGLGLDLLAEQLSGDVEVLLHSLEDVLTNVVSEEVFLETFYVLEVTEPSAFDAAFMLSEVDSADKVPADYVAEDLDKVPVGVCESTAEGGDVFTAENSAPSSDILSSELQETSIVNLDLNVRAKNVLLRNGIKTLGMLVKLSESDLLRLKNCGRDTAEHIKTKVGHFFIPGSTSRPVVPESDSNDSDEPVEGNKLDELGLEIDLSMRLLELGLNSVQELQSFDTGSLAFLLTTDQIKAINIALSNNKFEQLEAASEVSARQTYTLEVYDTNPLLEPISLDSVGKITLALLEQNSIQFFWQCGYADPRVLLRVLGVRSFCEVTKNLLALGISKLPLTVPEHELALLQCLYFYLQIERGTFSLLTSKELEVYRKRKLRTEPLTLEEVGQLFGVTRERIRQIEAKALRKLRNHFNLRLRKVILILEDALKEAGGVLVLDRISLATENRICFNNFLQNVLNLQAVVDLLLNLLCQKNCVDSGSLGEQVFHSLCQASNENSFEHYSRENVHAETVKLLHQIRVKTRLEDIALSVTQEVLDRHLICDGMNTYRRRDVPIAQQLTGEFGRLYPNGARVYNKSGDELWENLCNVIPDLKKRGGPRYIAQVFGSHDDIFLWDFGLYIHRQNVKCDIGLIDQIVEQCLAEFDRGNSSIKVHLLFDRNQERLENNFVPSSQALYSLLRDRRVGRLRLTDYPMIYDASVVEGTRKQTDLIEDYIREEGGKASRAQIIEHFSNRGWRTYEIEQTLRRCNQVFMTGGNYMLKEAFTVSEVGLKALIEKIVEELDKHSHFNINFVRREYPVLWHSVCGRSLDAVSMMKVLSKIADAPFKTNRLYITRLDATERKVGDEISEWVLNYGDYVSIEQLENEFCQNRGYPLQSVKLALYWTELLTCYEDCVVHPDVIGCGSDTFADIRNILVDASEVQAKSGKAHVPFAFILNKYGDSLPKLHSNFDWNASLLTCLTERLDIAYVFHESFVLRENDFNVSDLDDLIGFVIGSHFNSYKADTKELEKYLRSQSIIELSETVRRDGLFFEGSSIELVDLESNVILSAIGRERYFRQ